MTRIVRFSGPENPTKGQNFTLERGSSAKQASRMASETWSLNEAISSQFFLGGFEAAIKATYAILSG
jgi:hypothetical protein